MIFERVFGKVLHREKFSLKNVFALFSFIFVVWAFYRYFPGLLPEWVEELILKPLIWLTPTFWLVRRIEKQPLASLGFTRINLFPSLYWGVGLGIVFALEGLITNVIKYRGFHFTPLGYTPLVFLGSIVLSFVTAFSEETVFRGYIFNRLRQVWQNEWLANIIAAFLFSLIHLPIGIFVLGYTPVVMLAYLFFVFIFGFGSGFAFARTGNIVSSILMHVFWSWPILLFR